MRVAPRKPSVGTPGAWDREGGTVHAFAGRAPGHITHPRQTMGCFKITLTLRSSGESARKLFKTRSRPILRGEPSQVGVRCCKQNTIRFGLNAPNPNPASTSPFPLLLPLPLHVTFPDPHAEGPGPHGERRSAKVPGSCCSSGEPPSASCPGLPQSGWWGMPELSEKLQPFITGQFPPEMFPAPPRACQTAW